MPFRVIKDSTERDSGDVLFRFRFFFLKITEQIMRTRVLIEKYYAKR